MIEPARVFTDMHDTNCYITVEQNADKLGPYAMQGGVWLCIKNGNAGRIAAIDLTDDTAAQLGEFLCQITARTIAVPDGESQ